MKEDPHDKLGKTGFFDDLATVAVEQQRRTLAADIALLVVRQYRRQADVTGSCPSQDMLGEVRHPVPDRIGP
jgi:hypothetical protein